MHTTADGEDEVWAAGGHPHYVLPTTFDELVRITERTPADFGAWTGWLPDRYRRLMTTVFDVTAS